MKTIKFRSPLPLTSFAPQWDFNIALFQYEHSEKIREFLIQKEKYILQLDHNKAAGKIPYNAPNNITSRLGNYNLFAFDDECSELSSLLDWIRLCYLEFLQHESSLVSDVKIDCWYNILRDGMNMKEHIHSSGPSSYLSGNMQFSSFTTETNYIPPLDKKNGISIQGDTGQLVLFPSYVPHSVNHKYIGKRISIAFDLYKSNNTNKEPHWGNGITFMDKDIYKRLTK